MPEEKDRYAEPRASLRETAKWYSAALAALGAALAGGLSFGILPELAEDDLGIGILIGLVVFFAILAAILMVQEILFPKPFDRDRLKKEPIKTLVQPYIDELTPRDVSSLEDLWTKFEDAKDDPEEFVRLRTVLAKVTSFAAFLDLQRKIRRTNWAIMGLFVVACAGIGYLAYLQGIAKQAASADYVAVGFAPGAGWTKLSAALADACPGAEPISAEGRADTPFDGWWTIRLIEPEACAGASFSVPAAVITPQD